MKLSLKLGESQFHSDTGEGSSDPQADMLIQNTLHEFFQAAEKVAQAGGGQQKGGAQQGGQQQFGGQQFGGGQQGGFGQGQQGGFGPPPNPGQLGQQSGGSLQHGSQYAHGS